MNMERRSLRDLDICIHGSFTSTCMECLYQKENSIPIKQGEILEIGGITFETDNDTINFLKKGIRGDLRHLSCAKNDEERIIIEDALDEKIHLILCGLDKKDLQLFVDKLYNQSPDGKKRIHKMVFNSPDLLEGVDLSEYINGFIKQEKTSLIVDNYEEFFKNVEGKTILEEYKKLLAKFEKIGGKLCEYPEDLEDYDYGFDEIRLKDI